MKYQYNDGGRKAAGYKGKTGDCVTRAIAIAADLPYAEVYARLAKETGNQRAGKNGKRSASAANGINVNRKWYKDYMISLGFAWVPTMGIGTGCKVHLDANELPAGRLVVHVSKHSVCILDGVIHDTFNPDRGGSRCVYGYWIKQ
jgi:hypothetical protein